MNIQILVRYDISTLKGTIVGIQGSKDTAVVQPLFKNPDQACSYRDA